MSAAGQTGGGLPVFIALIGIVLGLLVIGMLAFIVSAVVFESEDYGEVEQETVQLFHDKINEQRVDHGAGEVTFHVGLADVARDHSYAMADSGIVDHEGPDGSQPGDRIQRSDQVHCEMVSENVGKTWYTEETNTNYGSGVSQYDSPEELATGLVNQFMNSESHREGLLDARWERAGISIVITDENRVYTTHKFCP